MENPSPTTSARWANKWPKVFRPGNEEALSWVLLVFCALVWGASYFLIKKSMRTFAWYEVGSLRIGLTSLVFLPMILLGAHKIRREDWKWLAVVGFCGNGVPAFLFSFAQTQIQSSFAGILNAMTPLWVLIVGALLFGRPFGRPQLAGVLLGLCGAVFLIAYGQNVFESRANSYGLFVIAATMLYGISTNTIGRLGHIPGHLLLAGSFLWLAPFALTFLAYDRVWIKVVEHEYGWQSFAAVCWLAIMGTVVASMAYVKVIHLAGPLTASLSTYLMPIVSIGWGLYDGESLGAHHGIGLALILCGLWMTQRAKIRAGAAP
jgi:drug/metabolite transporter (DMT)-like permease